MKLETVRCNECGAPLQITESTKFTKCKHCGSELSVQRTDDSVFTEKIAQQVEQIAQNTAQVLQHTQNLEAIRLQGEIEKLDREWKETQKKYMERSEDGASHEPGGPSYSGFIFGGAFAALLLFSAATVKFALFQGLAGLLGVIMAIYAVCSLSGGRKRAEYLKLKGEYETKRNELNGQLSKAS